jgi:hypothetical protein
MIMTTITATIPGIKYKSAVDGVDVAAGAVVAPGALAVKNASSYDA